MSLSEILGSAVSGLVASQAGMRTVSNNIANVSTPGYARERITLSAGVTAGRVSGVITGEPQRIADRFLEANAYRRASDVGRADVSATYQDRLQALLGAPGAESGLPARLDAISASAVAMSASAASAQTRAAFAGNVEDAVNSMQQLDVDVATLRADTDTELKAGVDTINGLLQRINDLNSTVAQDTSLGRSGGAAFGQRLTALDQLSGLIKVNIRDQPDGKVTIDSAQGTVLLDGRLRQLNYPISTTGTAQPIYAPIEVRFGNSDGSLGAATGERLEGAATGGKLGGLIDLRDNILPGFSEKLGLLFSGIAETLNAASNAGTAVPAPNVLTGRNSGLVAADRFGFAGAAIFAVTAADGTLIQKARVDFTALPASATVADAVAAINTALAGAGTASFSGGQLSIAATGATNGVVVAQDAASPSDRAGTGFSQFFGLNDVIQSPDSALVPMGLVASDPHGFGVGESANVVLRDSSGRVVASHQLAGTSGPTMGDLITELNGSTIGAFGSFALDSRGRLGFTATAGVAGAALSVSADSTNRLGTGRSFTALVGLSGAAGGLARAAVRPQILTDPTRLPLARFEASAAVGAKAIGAGDLRGAVDFSDQLNRTIDFGKAGKVSTATIAQSLIGTSGSASAQATAALADANARRDDAVSRRDNFSGVNIDEELSQMVVLQNSYSAAARVISTASAMYDTLLAMVT